MQIPQSDILTTSCLGRVFTNKSATYKFFWLMSILQIHAKTGMLNISVWDCVSRMVPNAWYPIHYFRLSFGKADSLSVIINELHRLTQIPIDVSTDEITRGLKEDIGNPQVKQHLRILTNNVPYHFLSPWIPFTSNEDVVAKSSNLETRCPYSLHDGHKEISSLWGDYLIENYEKITKFIEQELRTYLKI